MNEVAAVMQIPPPSLNRQRPMLLAPIMPPLSDLLKRPKLAPPPRRSLNYLWTYITFGLRLIAPSTACSLGCSAF